MARLIIFFKTTNKIMFHNFIVKTTLLKFFSKNENTSDLFLRIICWNKLLKNIVL